ncbi:unnamed protein product [Linum tenue]|uniref:Uncharacterized protein n=1 Tax=Linum tenue TaxID=586396 RepID=A0AAV0IQA5_9ROSI|nr:unnamed protein product [Linum tenue]
MRQRVGYGSRGGGRLGEEKRSPSVDVVARYHWRRLTREGKGSSRNPPRSGGLLKWWWWRKTRCGATCGSLHFFLFEMEEAGDEFKSRTVNKLVQDGDSDGGRCIKLQRGIYSSSGG